MSKNIELLKNRVIEKIDRNGNESLIFRLKDGDIFKMYHIDDCCEDVYLDDIIGDLNDLIDSPIIMAELSTNSGDLEDYSSYTWSFYKLATIKGYVTLRWYGESNGYYSEEVEFEKINKNIDI